MIDLPAAFGVLVPSEGTMQPKLRSYLANETGTVNHSGPWPLAQSRQLILPRLHRNLLRRRRKARNYKALVLAEPVAAVVPRSDDLIFLLLLSSCLFLWMCPPALV